MFRGFELILKGKDPQAGLIVTPRICGICGGSHLYKSVYALDTAWKTHVPPNATRVRNIAQACETLQSIPRWFYALFGIDLANKMFAKAELYDEAVRRFAPFVGTSYEPGLTLSAKPVEVYALFGGQWPHSSFMIPGGVMCAPGLTEVTRATAILDEWKQTLAREDTGSAVRIDRWLENKSCDDVLAWIDESPAHATPTAASSSVLHADGSRQDRRRRRPLHRVRHVPQRRDVHAIRRSRAVTRRSARARASTTASSSTTSIRTRSRKIPRHSFYRGSTFLNPFEGVTEPIDPQDGKKQDKYSWAKSPRYDVPGKGFMALEAGPLARQVVAGRDGAAPFQDYDPLTLDMVKGIGPSVMVRVLARMQEAPKYWKRTMSELKALDLQEAFYTKPVELPDGQGYGGTEAARGALMDFITLKDGKIENYQVVTPTAWNVGPRDGRGNRGPIETALIGTPIADQHDPLEIGIIARSFDSCLVCTVHAYDGKTGKELARYRTGAMT